MAVNDPKLIWKGNGIRISLAEHESGEVSLVRATDYDSGPADSLRLPDGAVGPVISALFGIQISKAGRGILAQLASAKEPGGA